MIRTRPALICAPLLLGVLLLVIISSAIAQPLPPSGIAVVVGNGFEMHAALTSPQVTWLLVSSNVSACGVGAASKGQLQLLLLRLSAAVHVTPRGLSHLLMSFHVESQGVGACRRRGPGGPTALGLQ